LAVKTVNVFREDYEYNPHPAQRLVHASEARIRCLVCVPEDTFLLGENKEAKDISVGDVLLGCDGGEVAVVDKIYASSSSLVEVNARGLLPFKVTPEHPLLVSEVDKNSNYYAYSKGRRNRKTVKTVVSTMWVEAGDVECLLRGKDYKTEYYLHLPVIKPASNLKEYRFNNTYQKYRQGSLPLNKDTAWAIGLYIAEGFGKRRVNWSLCNDEGDKAERLKSIFEELGYYVSIREKPDVSLLVVSVSSASLARLFRDICGHGAHNKHIPYDILYHEDEEILASCLRGYLDGDAFQRKNTLYVEGNTRSIRLAYELQLATARLGQPLVLHNGRSDDSICNGQLIKGSKRYCFSITGYDVLRKMGYDAKNPQQDRSFYIKHGDYFLMKLKSAKTIHKQTRVINFTTSDGTFLVSNIVTHNCGRKWGKTTLAINEVVEYAGVPESIIWWVSPTYGVGDVAWKRLLLNLNPLIIKRKSERDKTITLINDTVVAFKSADNEKGLVGEGLDFVVMEEAAYIKESVWYETVRPNLGDSMRKGDALLITTPNGMNYVYREWLKGQDKRFLDYESWRFELSVLPILNEVIDNMDGGFPSWTNPHWTRKELLSIIHQPRNILLQEYGGRFVEDLSNVFTGVDQVIDRSIGLEDPVPGKKYYVGFDVARRGAGDNAVITVVDGDLKVCREVVMNGKPLPVQVRVAKEICEEYNGAPILVDTTNPMGDSVFEFIYEEYNNAKGFHYTNANKRDLMDNLSIVIQTRKLKIPMKNDELEELVRELKVFGADRTRNGNIVYSAPPGFKDDRPNALALAVWLAMEHKQRSKPFARFMVI